MYIYIYAHTHTHLDAALNLSGSQFRTARGHPACALHLLRGEVTVRITLGDAATIQGYCKGYYKGYSER